MECVLLEIMSASDIFRFVNEAIVRIVSLVVSCVKQWRNHARAIARVTLLFWVTLLFCLG